MLRLLPLVVVLAWAPYVAAAPPELEPLDPSDWNVRRAAHLLNRAGFGGTPSEVVALAMRPFEEAIGAVVDFERAPGLPAFRERPFDEDDERWWMFRLRATGHHQGQVEKEAREATARLLDRALEGRPAPKPRRMAPRDSVAGLEQRLAAGVRLTAAEINRVVDARVLVTLKGRHRYELHMQLRNDWIRRMLATPRPLEEKLTLFWHGHFATSMAKVKDGPYMIRQHRLLRREAAGSFGRLLRSIAVDPAMLIYLDGAGSSQRQPNENFARELLELFTLGIGHYTEADVRAAARAFTGWSWDQPYDRKIYYQHRTLSFRADRHDDGVKTFLGQTGRWRGEDILRILLARPQTARFLTGKLCRYFLGFQPRAAVVESLAATLREHDYELKPFLRRLFRSRLFHAESTIGAKIKSPAELLIGTLRTLGVRAEDLTQAPTDMRMRQLDELMRLMGQQLLHPPTVKGWEGGRLWINSATTLVRQNVLEELVTGRRAPRRGAPDTPALMPAERLRLLDQLTHLRSPAELLDHLIARLLARRPSPAHRARMLAVLGEAQGFDPRRADTRQRILKLILLLMSTPEYQLC